MKTANYASVLSFFQLLPLFLAACGGAPFTETLTDPPPLEDGSTPLPEASTLLPDSNVQPDAPGAPDAARDSEGGETGEDAGEGIDSGVKDSGKDSGEKVDSGGPVTTCCFVPAGVCGSGQEYTSTPACWTPAGLTPGEWECTGVGECGCATGSQCTTETS